MAHKRTFDKMWFPEKDKLVHLVNLFNKNEIPKLAVLLHGEPGTGKSSTIKALATATANCSYYCQTESIYKRFGVVQSVFPGIIVYVFGQLSKAGNGSAYHPMHERMFVFEDIDCENEIVLKRDTSEDAEKVYTPAEISAIFSHLEKTHQGSTASVVKPSKKDTKDDDTNDKDDTDEKKPLVRSSYDLLLSALNAYKAKKKNQAPATAGRLTLAGLLNIMDGLLELRGCVIVMTTNHRSKLDPA